MLIAWTTVPDKETALTLARAVVEAHLAVCVQIEGPIDSFYRWEGKVEQSQEFRLCFKTTAGQAQALEGFVLARHPYEIPEWVVLRSEYVGEKYLSWAVAVSTSSTL